MKIDSGNLAAKNVSFVNELNLANRPSDIVNAKSKRRTSIRTPAIAGLKRQLTAIKKTYFEENEAKPLVTQMFLAIQKIHKLGIVHRDLNPGNIFLHFPDLPAITSPVLPG